MRNNIKRVPAETVGLDGVGRKERSGQRRVNDSELSHSVCMLFQRLQDGGHGGGGGQG